MKKESIERFLEQFSTSKAQIATWPKWMQESAKTASASFPRTFSDSTFAQVRAGVSSQRQKVVKTK